MTRPARRITCGLLPQRQLLGAPPHRLRHAECLRALLRLLRRQLQLGDLRATKGGASNASARAQQQRVAACCCSPRARPARQGRHLVVQVRRLCLAEAHALLRGARCGVLLLLLMPCSAACCCYGGGGGVLLLDGRCGARAAALALCARGGRQACCGRRSSAWASAAAGIQL